MTPNQYEKLKSAGYKKIPVVKEVIWDCDTPVATFLKVANIPYTYLFESVIGGEKWGRFSIVGLAAHKILTVKNHKIQVVDNGDLTLETDEADPLSWIENFRKELKFAPNEKLPIFTGGLVGYFGYETIRYIEPKLAKTKLPDKLRCPDILLMVSEELLIFDNLNGRMYLVTHADGEQPDGLNSGLARLEKIHQSLGAAPVKSTVPAGISHKPGKIQHEFAHDDYKKGVTKIKEYISAGDVMQVVLSQRMSMDYPAHPFNMYRALRSLNPSPYMFYLDLDEFQIAGSSPEILVRLEKEKITVRPIAGTRKRGRDENEDKELEQELLTDPKELAEHLMLIDLGRNDVGKVSKTGTVVLTEDMGVERYSHVMHIVSNVEGELKAGKTAFDVLRSTFPAGTLSGAPKIRAMEIINEFELSERGVYGGAVGYIGWNGNMDTAIAIRTAIIKDEQLYLQAGAGIVHDSDPEFEWQETLNKGKAVLKAVELALHELKL